jgi:hypothetical protein
VPSSGALRLRWTDGRRVRVSRPARVTVVARR